MEWNVKQVKYFCGCVCVEARDELQREVGDAETEAKLGGPAGQTGSPALRLGRVQVTLDEVSKDFSWKSL